MKRINLFTVLTITIVTIITLLIIKLTLPFYSTVITFIWKIVMPFLIAMVLSYLLYPLLTLCTSVFNMHKTSAICVIFITLFTILSFIIYYGMPVLFMELEELGEQLPQLMQLYEQIMFSIYDSTAFLPEPAQEQIDSLIINVQLTVENYVERLINRLIQSFDNVISLLIIPVLVFYLLKDFDKIKAYVFRLLPNYRKRTIERLLEATHEAFGTYIRGQMLLSLFIFTITFLLFQLIGLKYAFVLSLFMGLMNVIPYFGPIIGTVPAVVIALATSWQLVIYVLIIAIIVQIIESALLSPYIMGKTAQLHPIAIIFILLVSSELGGIVAMIIAIPAVMIVRAIFINVSEGAIS